MQREQIVLGGYEMWLDVERSILFDTEKAKHGFVFDIMGSGDHIWINSYPKMTKEEAAELVNYVKKFYKNCYILLTYFVTHL